MTKEDPNSSLETAFTIPVIGGLSLMRDNLLKNPMMMLPKKVGAFTNWVVGDPQPTLLAVT